ncbi:hypothetical protein SAMN05880582_11365 [Rhizobium sp. RU20A]|uniref:hypothetical protein n=1 Tax=Rhizobium sp. RU20A TaxID=1907412 RepID=UPI0009563EDD|nr:hypothetical protein [Rhizobium sp. RU20A]SIR43608.1 hypothetical protein SAMN05880582_11365 [Rhizobium sp. RU20A]
MSGLIDWLMAGWVGALALVVLWLEVATLCLAAPQPRARLAVLAPNALAGSFLLAAVGLALSGAGDVPILALMAGSLVAHGVDMLARFRRPHSGA